MLHREGKRAKISFFRQFFTETQLLSNSRSKNRRVVLPIFNYLIGAEIGLSCNAMNDTDARRCRTSTEFWASLFRKIGTTYGRPGVQKLDIAPHNTGNPVGHSDRQGRSTRMFLWEKRRKKRATPPLAEPLS